MVDKVRPSKAVMTHGPGALIDLKEGKSGMVMSPDYWKSYRKISDWRLAKYLKVLHFRSPKNRTIKTEEGYKRTGVQIRDFPKRWYCPKCRFLKPGTWKCNSCSEKEGRDIELVVPRVVAACTGGHIQDFPWEFWIGCKCRQSKIKLEGSSKSSSDLLIKCISCNKHRNLRGALGELQCNCRGNRPWIGDKEANEKCDRKLHGLMKGASNTYFPITVSSILIPPYSSKIHNIIEPYEDTIREYQADGANLENFTNRNFSTYLDEDSYTIDDFMEAYQRLSDDSTEEGLKDEEWATLCDPPENTLSEENVDFSAEINRHLENHSLKAYFDKIVLVRRLTEVIALTGFTRIHTPMRKLDGSDKKHEGFAMGSIRERKDEVWNKIYTEMKQTWQIPEDPSGRDNSTSINRKDWLPAVKNRGEGILIVFNKERLEKWEKDSNWKKIVEEMAGNANFISKPEGFDDEPRSLLIHTFSHLLAIEIAKECGYQLASIRERIYSSKKKRMYGVLLYTSASDSQGSLGGLISQAKDLDLMQKHIENMSESARICSQDPLCGEHDPKNTGKAWGASCHSCTNLPETSCEAMMNQFLDRHTVIGNQIDKPGYFD